MEPGDCPFDDPPHDAEAAAVGRAAARDHRDDALRVQPIAMRLGVVAAVPWRTSGRRRGRPRRPRTAGSAATNGSSCVMSFTLAAVTCATSGTPRASVMT
jgi:hypothetical protein